MLGRDICFFCFVYVFFQAEDGIRDLVRSRGLGVCIRDRNISSVTETFSDSSGGFATNEIGIPINAELGTWKITAHSRLDTKSIDINVNQPTERGITLEIEGTEFTTGQIIQIKGIAQSDTSRLVIDITDESDTIVSTLETPITSDGTFSLPWVIPSTFDTGTYTITVHDADNSDSIEIFIQ